VWLIGRYYSGGAGGYSIADTVARIYAASTHLITLSPCYYIAGVGGIGAIIVLVEFLMSNTHTSGYQGAGSTSTARVSVQITYAL
jgi:hypothetical protein